MSLARHLVVLVTRLRKQFFVNLHRKSQEQQRMIEETCELRGSEAQKTAVTATKLELIVLLRAAGELSSSSSRRPPPPPPPLPTTSAANPLKSTFVLLGIYGTFVLSYHFFLPQNPLRDFDKFGFGFGWVGGGVRGVGRGVGAGGVDDDDIGTQTPRTISPQEPFYSVFTVLS